MKHLIAFVAALSCIGILTARESPDSLMQRMLRHLQEPHSYEIVLGKRDNEIPDRPRIAISKNGPRFHARVYLGNELAQEEIFDGTTRYHISQPDSSVIITGRLAPGDANLYLLALDDLGLAYVDRTNERTKNRNLCEIGVYEPDADPEQPLIIYTIDPVALIPCSLRWSAEGHEDLFRNFKFGINFDDSEFTFDRTAMKDYTIHDYR